MNKQNKMKQPLNNGLIQKNSPYKFTILNQSNSTKKFYENIIAVDLLLKQNYKTIMQLPKIHKILLNTTSKIYVNDKKHIFLTLAAFELISGQKPRLTLARQSVSNFKIRQNQILGCKLSLSEGAMYMFLEKLSKIVFPKIRDFSKKSKFKNSIQYSSTSKTSTVNLGFQNMMIFPELENHYELVESFRGMNMSFILKNSTPKTCLLVLSGFQLPVSSL